LLDGYAGRPATQRQVHGAISRLYAWGRRVELVAINPTADIETTTAPACERVLTLPELAKVWRAADQLDPLYRDLVHLMILTGQRRGEVAGMRWGEIDLARALWTLPGGRTKARRQHVVPLSATAAAILKARQKAFQRRLAGELVLSTSSRDGKGGAQVSGWNWLKDELDQRSGIAGWRLHDFRRSLVTIMADKAGGDVAVLDSLLNHASSATRGGVTGVYQRAILVEPMRKLTAAWDALISQAIKPIGKRAVRQRRKG
jgi:integrase